MLKSGYSIFKGVTSSDSDFLKNNASLFITKFLVAAFIFFVPTIVSSIMGLVSSFNKDSFATCWNVTQNSVEGKLVLDKNNCAEKEGFEWNEVLNICRKVVSNKVGNVNNLKLIAQGNYKNVPFCNGRRTVANSGCGAAAFAMIASAYSSPTYTMEYVANWFCTNKFSLANGALSNSAVLDSDTLAHFNLNAELIFGNNGYGGSKYNASWGQAMLKAVQEGKSVMFGMPRHWAVVGPNDSCSPNQVYLYDPGYTSRVGCYTPEQLFSKTYNSGNHCTKEGICGWDIGIALW